MALTSQITSSNDDSLLVIEAGRSERHYWLDLWRYRELLAFLAWRDFLVRYKQTSFGVAWALLRPLVTMIVFALVFGRLAHLPSAGAPYPLFVLAAVLPWQFFANSVSDCSMSLVSNANFLSKVYFPRLLVPASAVIVSAVDLVVSLVLLAAFLVWYRYLPDTRILTLPLFMLQALLCSLGLGLWLAALTVKYRDFRYVVPFIVQFGLFISPVGFSSEIVPETWRLVYSINPLVGVIEGVRWAALRGTVPLYGPGLLLSAATSLLLFLTGLTYFRRTERHFADVV